MKKYIVCLLMCVMMVFVLVGCANSKPNTDEKNTNQSSENVATEEKEPTEEPGVSEEKEPTEEAGTTEDAGVTEETETEPDKDPADEAMNLEELFQKGMDSYAEKDIEAPVLFPEMDVNYIENFYPGISAIEVKQIYVAMAPVTNAPMEIALVEVANASDVEKVRDIFQNRIDERANDSAYPEESAVWKQNAKVTIRGNYVFMAVMTDDYGIPEEFILE